jgi:hypothetical protein
MPDAEDTEMPKALKLGSRSVERSDTTGTIASEMDHPDWGGSHSATNALRPRYIESHSGPGAINTSGLAMQDSHGSSDAAYAARATMSSIESFSTVGFMRALPIPARAPCLIS